MSNTQPACELCALNGMIEINQLPEETELNGNFSTYNPNSRLYPTETELIHLVNLEYQLDINDICIHACYKKRGLINSATSWIPLVGPTNANEIAKLCEYLDNDDRKWRLVTVFAQESWLGTQHGAAFFNTVSKQLVIAHRGTEFLNPATVTADAKEVVEQEIGRFGYVAHSFTKQVVEKYGRGAVSITVTGHSLGGWLAQVATFFMKYPQYLNSDLLNDAGFQVWAYETESYGAVNCDNLVKDSYHLHCVSFDGPGCKEVITKLFPKYGDDRKLTFQVLDSLDITVYLTRLNFTNLMNEQIGSVFRMKCEDIFAADPELSPNVKGWFAWLGNRVTCKGTREWLKRFFLSHKSDKILDFWLRVDSGSVSAGVLQVTDWLIAGSAWQYKKTMSCNELELPEFKRRNPFKFRMSIFSELARDKIELLTDCKDNFMKDELWAKGYEVHSCVEHLTTGFRLKHDFQIIKILVPDVGARISVSQNTNLALYRDYFIRRMKAAVRKVELLKINCIPPRYVEAMYIRETDHYGKSLPKFRDSEPSPFQFILDHFKDRSTTSCIISVPVPKGNTRICTAKIYQILQKEWLAIPLQYFVLSSRQLAKLDHILENVDMNPFLRNLKYVVIECETEFDLRTVQSWVERLYLRSGSDGEGLEIVTKIVVVHSLSPGTSLSTNMDFDHGFVVARPVSEGQVIALRKDLDVESLVRDGTVEFKLKGNRIKLSDLVPLSNTEFYARLAEDSSKLYFTLFSGAFGSLLPQLDSFEETYYLGRKFFEIEVIAYSREELMIVVCQGARAGHLDEFVTEFIRKRYSERELSTVVCSNIALFDQKVHKFLLIPKFTPEMKEFVKVQGLSSHLVRLKRRLVNRASVTEHYDAISISTGTESGESSDIDTDSDADVDINSDTDTGEESDTNWISDHYSNSDTDTDTDSNSDKREFSMVWQRAFGQADLSNLTLRTGCQRSCDELFDDNPARLTIITDEPGMGKTTLMKNLAMRSQKSVEGSTNSCELPWTIFVPLDKVRGILRESMGSPVTLEQVVGVLAAIEAGAHTRQEGVESTESIVGIFLREFLIPQFESSSQGDRLRIFIDGLDEINDELKEFVLSMGEVLLRETYARVFIAGRKRLASELRKRFGIPVYKLKPLDKEERVQFLPKYWTNHKEFKERKYDESINEDACVPFVEAFLDKFRKAIGAEAEKFVGIPFQLRMLAVAFMKVSFFDFCEKYAGAQRESEELSAVELKSCLPTFTNITELYKLFIETKIREALKEKYGLDLEQKLAQTLEAQLRTVHKLAGFDNIFCGRQRKKITGQDLLKYPEADDIEGMHLAGLVTHYMRTPESELEDGNCDETEFVHRTIAEFLSAEFILENMTREPNPKGELRKPGPEMQFFLDSHIFLPKNENVFNFLNLLIMHNEQTPPIFRNVSNLRCNIQEILAYLHAKGNSFSFWLFRLFRQEFVALHHHNAPTYSRRLSSAGQRRPERVYYGG